MKFQSLQEFRNYKSHQLLQFSYNDYIGFRQLCFLELPSVSLLLFAGQQAIEKVLKGIHLLYNESVYSTDHKLMDLWKKGIEIAAIKKEYEKYEHIIKEFEDGPNSRYAAVNFKIEPTLIHRLDYLYLKILRQEYMRAYYSNTGINIASEPNDYLFQICELGTNDRKKNYIKNTYNALTHQNLVFNKDSNSIGQTTGIKFKIEEIELKCNEKFTSSKEFSKKVGLKIYNEEFNKIKFIKR